jgi:hypothetical protein
MNNSQYVEGLADGERIWRPTFEKLSPALKSYFDVHLEERVLGDKLILPGSAFDEAYASGFARNKYAIDYITKNNNPQKITFGDFMAKREPARKNQRNAGYAASHSLIRSMFPPREGGRPRSKTPSTKRRRGTKRGRGTRRS